MKKKLLLLLVSLMCISLCACGKSENVVAVEEAITTLSETSSYREIGQVYKLYDELNHEDSEKVDNVDVLEKYIELGRGKFALTNELIAEIENHITPSENLGISAFQGTVMANGKSEHGFLECEVPEITKTEQIDEYTYEITGNFKAKDEYNDVVKCKFTAECYFVPNTGEKENEYWLITDIKITQKN